MKKLRLLLWLFVPTFCHAQDTIQIHHTYYSSTFIRSKHIPFLVKYTLTKQMLDCDEHLKRKNFFTTDPELHKETELNKDYKTSGYDKGHCMPAEDNDCSTTGMTECFYYSNIFPQAPSLNRGIWKALENKEREEANEFGSVEVFIGYYGIAGYIGADSVAVPEYCWKVIYANGKYQAYIFPNTDNASNDLTIFKTTISEIAKKTNISFFKCRDTSD
ncbi:MAG TPA: DNA/RNA non-specific endonuclease [Flavipsychrobacter sp.]|nr:DNA/RNA non-specific endonuclease [Flavipsychrobacter sp.]